VALNEQNEDRAMPNVFKFIELCRQEPDKLDANVRRHRFVEIYDRYDKPDGI
jgi:hypothetical protein